MVATIQRELDTDVDLDSLPLFQTTTIIQTSMRARNDEDARRKSSQLILDTVAPAVSNGKYHGSLDHHHTPLVRDLSPEVTQGRKSERLVPIVLRVKSETLSTALCAATEAAASVVSAVNFDNVAVIDAVNSVEGRSMVQGMITGVDIVSERGSFSW